MNDELYANPEVCQAILMDYYRNPRCSGLCDPATHTAEAHNPACGDVVKLTFHRSGDLILQARTKGAGCAVSQASASLLAEQLEGKTAAQASVILEKMAQLLEGNPADSQILGNLAALAFIAANPARVRCAQVALEAARGSGICGAPPAG